MGGITYTVDMIPPFADIIGCFWCFEVSGTVLTGREDVGMYLFAGHAYACAGSVR